jgi:hypothetical protein
MALASGLAGQVGWAIETTPGTRVTPTGFQPFLSENVRRTASQIPVRGIVPGRVTPHKFVEGPSSVSGGFSMELAPQGLGKILKAAMGAVSTTGTNPYSHAFTLGDVDDDTLTVQIGRPSLSGTVHRWDYLGCSITDLTIAGTVGEVPTADVSFSAMKEEAVDAQTLASFTLPTGWAPFSFTHGSLTVAAAAVPIKSFTLSIANNLDVDRHRIRATDPKWPLQARRADYANATLAFVADFTDATQYNKYIAGTDVAISLAFNAGSSAQLTIAGNLRYTDAGPNIGGAELLEESLTGTFYSASSDAAALTVTLVNAESAP